MRAVFIDLEEWDAVACVVSRLLPNETGQAPGVALRHVEGHRRWTVCTPWVHLEVRGGRSDTIPTEPVWLPSRLVVHAAELASTEDVCALTVSARSATVANVMGDATFALLDFPGPPPTAMRAATSTNARATVPAVQLVSLLNSVRRLPAGVDLSARTAPDLALGIEPGLVSASVTWTRFGASSVTARVPANTRNEATTRVPTLDVALLFDAVAPELDVTLEIDLDDRVLWVETANWTAAVTLSVTPSSNDTGPTTLTEALERLGAQVRGEGRWRVKVNGVRVRVETLKHASVVRATVRLAKGITPDLAVLAEINDLNRGLVGTRVWLHNGTLRASVDVPTRALVGLEDRIASLVADTTGLGPLVAMLAETVR